MTRMRHVAAACAALATAALALAHGHPGNVDPATPGAWKYKLCGQMSDVAMRALNDRDKGRPTKQYDEDGTPGPRIANEIIRKVYAEPGISSPKRADAFGRGYCMEQLQGVED